MNMNGKEEEDMANLKLLHGFWLDKLSKTTENLDDIVGNLV
jgi:hypothetical protein